MKLNPNRSAGPVSQVIEDLEPNVSEQEPKYYLFHIAFLAFMLQSSASLGHGFNSTDENLAAVTFYPQLFGVSKSSMI